jgi:hypothetical protein
MVGRLIYTQQLTFLKTPPLTKRGIWYNDRRPEQRLYAGLSLNVVVKN